MAHFASVDWPTPYGPVATLSTNSAAMLAATASSSTEGTDKLTYTVVKTGIFRLSTAIRIRTASTAATSHVVAAQVAYNNGAAVSAADIGILAAAFTDIDAKTAETNAVQTQVIRAVAGTTITITVLNTVVGTGTGTYDLTFVIEQVGVSVV